MDMYRCDICPMSFLTESGVRRHLLCSHVRRFHRGRPSSLVPTELLEAAVQRSRAAQANSRQRRRVRAIQRAPPVNPPPVVGTELDGILNDFLQGWPDVPPLVVREAATQHDGETRRRLLIVEHSTLLPCKRDRRRCRGRGCWRRRSWFDGPLITPSRGRIFRRIGSSSLSWRSRRT